MIDFLTDDVSSLFVIEKLSEKNLNQTFVVDEKFSEYKDFLYLDALNYQSLFISQTYLLIEKETRAIIAYISLASDTVALNPREKKKVGLTQIPFLFLPALKITKLAVSSTVADKYKHIGSYLIRFACIKAFNVNTSFMACRLVSVDADVEHNPNILEFYSKNGFFPSKNSVYKKKFPNRTKTIGMWKDCFL